MRPIFTRKKVQKIVDDGIGIAIPVLSLVKDTSGAFPLLKYAATAALALATSIKGFRDCKQDLEEFSNYVTDMVGELALQWDVRSHSGSGESLEQWRRNIGELSELLTEISDEASKQVTEQASRSSARNFLSYVLDPGKMDGMSRKKKLDAVLSRFQLQTNIATGHTLAEVIQNDATILSKLDSIEDGLSNIDDDVTLAKLNFADGAVFNSSEICLPGTRKKMIGEIMDWCSNVEHDWKSQIVLLTAVAGAGKTTVALAFVGATHKFKQFRTALKESPVAGLTRCSANLVRL